MMIWTTLLGMLAGIVLLYLMGVVLLWRVYRRNPDQPLLREGLRLLPDLLRLLKRLAADHDLPRGVRLRLVFLLVYLASPIDLIPDFIPVLGYADDAIVTAWVLRSVAKHAGEQAIEDHWPGTPQGLDVVKRLARVA